MPNIFIDHILEDLCFFVVDYKFVTKNGLKC